MPVVELPADKQFLTEKELAELLRVVPSCVRAIRARGEIAFVKLGGARVKHSCVLYPRADVERFLTERLQPATKRKAA